MSLRWGAVLLDQRLHRSPGLVVELCAHVHPATLSRWRRGIMLPDAERLELIERVTGVPVGTWREHADETNRCALCNREKDDTDGR